MIWWHFSYSQWNFIASTNKSLIPKEFYLSSDKYEIDENFTLSVKNVQETDSGTYKCEVRNYKNFSAELTVVGRKI